MEPITENFTITLKYQVSIDAETGEMTTKCLSRTIDKAISVVESKKPKKLKSESTSPILTLEENKCILTQTAVDLMNIKVDDKIDIKYEKIDKKIVPIIGTDEAFQSKGGNRLTKSNTIACRGSKNTELAKYGSEFNIIPHPSKENLFILKPTNEIEEQEVEDIDIDLQDLIDNDVKEIDSNFFKL